MKSSPRRKLILALVVLALALVGWLILRPKETANSTGIGVVKRQNLEQRVTISGSIAPKRRSDVRAPYAGYIQKLYVKVGQKVKQGDPLIMFTQTLGGGERTFPVRSPFAGVVTQILKTEGDFVTDQGEQPMVLRIEDMSSLNVVAGVAELDIAKIKIGQQAMVRVNALLGEEFEGEISEIARGAREKDRYGSNNTEFQIRVELHTKDPRLYPGMGVLMDVITDYRENVLSLEHEYIQEEGGKYFVTLIDGSRRAITTGMQTELAAEITDGVKEGERVRVIPYLNLPTSEEE